MATNKKIHELELTAAELDDTLKRSKGITITRGEEDSEDYGKIKLTNDLNEDLGTIQDIGTTTGGLTLKYNDETGELRIYNMNQSSNDEDWTEIGNPVKIISADENAMSYYFSLTSVSNKKLIYAKSEIDKAISYKEYAIVYDIEEFDQKGNPQISDIKVTWTIKRKSNDAVLKYNEVLPYSEQGIRRNFDCIQVLKENNFYDSDTYQINADFRSDNGAKISGTWQLNVVTLELSVNFDKRVVFNEKQLPTIIADITGPKDSTKEFVATLINKQTSETKEVHRSSFTKPTNTLSFSIQDLVHGSYGITLVCNSIVNGVSIQDKYYGEFIYIEEGNDAPLIRWDYDENNPLTQLQTTVFEYGIYNPLDSVSPLDISLYNSNNNKTQQIQVYPDNRDYSWIYYPMTDSKGLKENFTITVDKTKTMCYNNFRNHKEVVLWKNLLPTRSFPKGKSARSTKPDGKPGASWIPSPKNRSTARHTTERNHRHGSGNYRLTPVIFLFVSAWIVVP